MSLTKTAEKLLADAKQLDRLAAAEGLTWESKLETLQLTEEMMDLRIGLVDGVQDLQVQALGTYDALVNVIFDMADIQCVRALVRHNIPAQVPDEGISFQDLATKVKLNETVLSRMLRLVMMHKIFCEPKPGFVEHTVLSKAMTMPDIFDTVDFFTEETHPAMFSMLDALEKWPESQEPNHTGFNLANDTSDVFYAYVAKHPERARRAGGCFRALGTYGYAVPKDFTTSHVWQEVDGPGKLFVDVGGNMGSVSQRIARVTKDLSFIVQDLADTCKFGEKELPAEFRDRISFKTHDFFTEQPVKGADMYFMRMILHDWPEKHCIQILQNLVPALRDGSKIVCCEVIMPETANPTHSEKRIRRADLTMLAVHNSTERTKSQWRSLFAQVDPRFQVEFESWPHTLHGLVIASWMPERRDSTAAISN